MAKKVLIIEVFDQGGQFLAEMHRPDKSGQYIKSAYGPTETAALRNLLRSAQEPNLDEIKDEVWQNNG